MRDRPETMHRPDPRVHVQKVRQHDVLCVGIQFWQYAPRQPLGVRLAR